MMTRKTLELADARCMAVAAEAEAVRRAIGVSIAICDDGGHLLWFQRMNGVAAIAVSIVYAKARMAALGRRPTSVFQRAIDDGMASLAAMPVMQGALEGGIPVIVDGAVVGGIAASGGSGEEDVAVAAAGLAALAG